jgi:mannan endo-1,4-beta-mannosidase
MKISRSILSLALASSAVAAPTLQAAGSAQQPPLAYPVGFSGGQNARVAGRVFDIDGRVQYFAGQLTHF